MKDYRKPTRKKTVVDIQSKHVRRGDVDFPEDEARRIGENVEELWLISTTTRTGLAHIEDESFVVWEKELAERLIKQYKISSEVIHVNLPREQRHAIIREALSQDFKTRFRVKGSGEALARQVLFDDGLLINGHGAPSEEVTTFLSAARIEKLQSLFGKDWQTVAAFEFTSANLPDSSLAFIAAAYLFHLRVSKDYLSAGYYWRDLEILQSEMEEEGQKTIDARKRAGQSGSKSSAGKRMERITHLLEKMEQLVARSPDFVRLGDGETARIAVEDCVSEKPELWSQGAGQYQEYLGEIRRGEAGEDARLRYQALSKYW